MVLDGGGAEIDWYIGYQPPPENVQKRLQDVLDGKDTFKALSSAYAANPKDAVTVFKLAAKLDERDKAKSLEKYREGLALDPEGKARPAHGRFSYAEFAEFTIATTSAGGQAPSLERIRPFVAGHPKSPLAKTAYVLVEYQYAYNATPQEAAKFYEEYAARFPDDLSVLVGWLSRILRDKGPADKAVEIAARLSELTDYEPSPAINQMIAQAYALENDKTKAEEVYGPAFMESRVTSLAYSLVAYADYWLDQGAHQDHAVKMAEKALALAPDNYFIVQQVAGVYLKLGAQAKALAIYGPDYVKKSASDPTGLWQYAGFWARQGKNLDGALAAAKSVLGILPRFYLAWNTLSLVYEKMDDRAEAVKAKEKALELAPDSVKAAYKKDLERLKSAAAPAKK